jgi:hypothetical protein
VPKVVHYRLGKGLKWTGRIIGFIILFFSINIITGNIYLKEYMFILPFIVTTLVLLIGTIISWWNEPVASALLVLSSLGLGIRTIYTHQVLMWMEIGLSSLVAGTLILMSWWISGKDRKSFSNNKDLPDC